MNPDDKYLIKTNALERAKATARLRTMSTLLSRAAISSRLGKQFGDERDLYDVLGYKLQIKFSDYYAKYQRQDIASRIVDAPAQATWRRAPIIYEDDPKRSTTKFEIAFNKLARKTKLFHFLGRADKVAGIGNYGLLLIGAPGALSTPIRDNSMNEDTLIYFGVYSEGSVEEMEYDKSPRSFRFGQPITYKLKLAGEEIEDIGIEETVHWSRILHIAEGKLEDEVNGVPRLRGVYNLLDDLEKVVGGSAEMFWQGAYRGLHVDIQPGYQPGDLDDAELSDLYDEVQEYIHGLTRVIRTQGVNIKPLDSQVADPRGVFQVVMDLISGTTKIPKRILIGSEEGKLASQQDEVNWNSRIAERQLQFAEGEILRPLIDRFIQFGALPEPKSGTYEIEWPSLFEQDELRRAQTAWTWARAIEKLAASLNTQITPEQAKMIMEGDFPEDMDTVGGKVGGTDDKSTDPARTYEGVVNLPAAER